jgi:hypothetical protein
VRTPSLSGDERRAARAAPAAAFVACATFLGSCAPDEHAVDDAAAVIQASAGLAPQQRFWENLSHHCGEAFAGRLTLEPPGDDMLTGTEELIVHFRTCTADRVEAPFHIEVEDTGEWDRSRTWIFTRGRDGLELRHDHRHEDGSEHEQNFYGGRTRDEGTANRQEFILAERTAPDGSPLGWRVEIEPGARYTYGTIRGGEWTWRVDFDLSRAVPPPPAQWGW